MILGASKERWRLELGAGVGAGGSQSGTWGGWSHCSEFSSLGSGDFGILGLAGRILQSGNVERCPGCLSSCRASRVI